MKYRKSKNSKPIPVLLDEALRERIAAVSERMGEPKSTVMRISMRMGLESLLKAFEENPQGVAQALSKAIYPEHVPQVATLNEARKGKPSSASADIGHTVTEKVKKGHARDKVAPVAGDPPGAKP